MSRPVLACDLWNSNAHLIADVARLGYLRSDWKTLDPTYGRGTWWKIFRPEVLVPHDLSFDGVDFRHLAKHHEEGEFDAVVFDPPYKMNGTPVLGDQDERYGVDGPYTPIDERLMLMMQGFVQCAHVLKPGGYLLVKCQDQVVSGKVVWQSDRYVGWAVDLTELTKVDRFDMLGGGRPQPAGRRQVHAHMRPSTLLVFQKDR